MCNHYRNNPELIPNWREYAGPAEYARWLDADWGDAVGLVAPYPAEAMAVA